MIQDRIPLTHCSLRDFLAAAAMSKRTFFVNYRKAPAYAALLDIRTDRLHRLWIAREAAGIIRAERPTKETHGNRGKCAVRVCRHCGHGGHPRHTYCRGCGESF
ncbi:MAG: hypothetical protein ABJB66_00015 [Gemmatimonadaceae bacterium]